MTQAPISSTEDQERVVIARMTKIAVKVLILSALVLLAYIPAMKGGFIWDDDEYVYQNPTLRSSHGLRDIWFKPGALPQYYPLTHTTFWIEYRLWQLHPAGYHSVNVVLHLLNALFLWRLLGKLGVPGAWCAALIFAVHPVHVESVAWVTERKNVLSGLFYLLSATSYLRFAKCLGQNAAGDQSTRTSWLSYIWSHLLFLAALFSKTVTATLPAALLLVIWFKKGRIRRPDVGLLIPQFLLGIALGLHTARIEREFVGAAGAEFDWTFLERFVIAGRTAWFYAAKLVWPHPLAFFYPKWEINPSSPVQWLFPLSVCAIVFTTWYFRRQLGRGPLAAILFFGGTLFPALGFFNVYPMKFSFVADHFQYLASIGIITLFTGTAAGWLKRLSAAGAGAFRRRIAAGPGRVFAAVVVGTFAALTWQHAYVLADLERLFRDTLRKNPGSEVAHNQLGLMLRQRGDLDEALEHFREAAKHGAPGDALNEANILDTEGEILLRQGATEEAIRKLEAAVETFPKIGRFHFILAEAYRTKGDIPEAVRHSDRAVEYGFRHPNALLQNARLHVAAGDYTAAIGSYRQILAVVSDPTSSAELGWILATHWDDRIRDLSEALNLAAFAAHSQPRNFRAFDALAAAEAARGRSNDAVSHAEKAWELALSAGERELAAEINQRLEAYRRGDTYRLPQP